MQAQEPRNAENLSESVGISARAMQRFLTEARWDDDAVIGRLQEYLAPKLEHPEAVWVLDGSDLPKQGRKSVGVARQYCGRLGKVANCQAGMFLAYVSPLGRALVDKRLYLPRVWASDNARCAAAGVPEERHSYRSKTELALAMLERALELGHLRAGWVAADDAFGMSRSFRDSLAALEMLAYVGGSRWRIETEFETEKGDVGLDEYEIRIWAGWHHHITLCLLGGAFLLEFQQDWGGKMPRITRPQVYRVVCEMLPRERFGPAELLLWLEESQLRNERARRSHQRLRSARREGRPEPPP